jgi:acyl-CoA thioester hydrolase
MSKPFSSEFTVRDYELDTQGVVNNSTYQNYLEHARHQFLKHIGLNFNQLHEDGTDAIVHKVELEYKSALRGDETFVVRTTARQKGNVRFVFSQNIYRLPDHELVLKGRVTTAFMSDGKAIRPPRAVTDAIERYQNDHL